MAVHSVKTPLAYLRIPFYATGGNDISVRKRFVSQWLRLFEVKERVYNYQNCFLFFQCPRDNILYLSDVPLDNAAIFIPDEGRVGKEYVDLVRRISPNDERYLPKVWATVQPPKA